MPKDRPIEFIARGLIRRGQWILVCRNVEAGYCYLPGGHVEFGESAAAALARELQEEAGLAVQVGQAMLVAEGAFIARGKPHHEVNVVFHVEQPGGDDDADSAPPPPVDSREPEIAFDWVDVASLVTVDLRPESIRAWLVAGTGAGESPCGWVSAFPIVE